MSGAWLPTGRYRGVANDKPTQTRYEHRHFTHQRPKPGSATRGRHTTVAWVEVTIKALASILLAANLVLLVLRRWHETPASLTKVQPEQEFEALDAPIPSSKLLYLAIPSPTDDDVNLCKTLLTAQVLNYPVPDLIRWGQSLTGEPITGERKARAKLLSIQSWFNLLPKQADDGLVILLSGPESWFQLRPEVVLQRYYDVVHSQSNGSHQSVRRIIFAAESDCQYSASLEAQSPPACQVLEGSYLSESVIIGPVNEVRALLDTAADMTSQRDWKDTWTVFDAIFALQEGEREGTEPVPFRIGLDTHHDLTLLADDALETRMYNNLEDTIHNSMPPFWTPSGQEADLPHGSEWEDVRLFGERSDVSRSPAAMVHFRTTSSMPSSGFDAGADVDAQAAVMENLWPYLWLQPYARALYTAAALAPTTVIAVVEDDLGGLVRFWGEERLIEKAGMSDRLHRSFRRWNETCQGKEQSEAIFLDLKGDWEAPPHL